MQKPSASKEDTTTKNVKLASPAGQKPKSFGIAVLAGGTAGAIEATAMFPTEYIKTQLQLQSKTEPLKFTGPWNCAVVTVREHGPLGLYRGLSTLLVGSVPKSAVRFTSFEVLSNSLKDEQGKLTKAKTFVAGLGAGMLEAIFAVTPMETIKTKLIHDQNSPPEKRKYRGLVHGVSTIVKNEGISGVYKGLFPTILKQSTNQGTRFLVYTELQKYFTKGDPNAPFGMLLSAFSGGVAGGVSVLVNNPLDVIKTQMQGLEASKYKSSFDCAKTILVTNGPMFFYKGVVPRLIRVCGDAAIAFSVYGQLVTFYSNLIEKNKH